MTTPTGTDHEYESLVREDAATWGPGPDAGSLVALGAPRLRRRRTALAGAAVLVAASAVVPALLLGGQADPDAPDDPVRRPEPPPVAVTSSAPREVPPATTVTMRGCGVLACVEGDVAVDTRPAIGEVMTIGTTRSGLEEVVWASERGLVDPTTQQDTTGVALMTGFVRNDVRVDALLALLPGAKLPPGCRMSFVPSSSADGGWALLGYVKGEFDRVTSTGGTLDGPVQSSTRVLPGTTVFVARGSGSDYPTSFTAGDVTSPVDGCQ